MSDHDILERLDWIAGYLKNIGFNNSALGQFDMGALEFIGSQLKDINEHISCLGGSSTDVEFLTNEISETRDVIENGLSELTTAVKGLTSVIKNSSIHH